MSTVTPFLWFDDRIEEAVNLYVSVFRNAKITSRSPGPNGVASSMTFELDGQRFMALNGGPHFKFSEAVSFFVKCETQAEVDHHWDALTANGGAPGRCGWLKDPYGLSWQIIPDALGRYMSDSDRGKAQRVVEAMMQMTKIDVAALDRAYAG